MRKIINGLRYDTEQADQIYSHWNGCSRSDFHFRSEDLYRTKKGKWFIHHDGGAMTDMAVSVGNNGRGGSESIEPIDDDAALDFLQSHSDDASAMKAIETYFAASIEEA